MSLRNMDMISLFLIVIGTLIRKKEFAGGGSKSA